MTNTQKNDKHIYLSDVEEQITRLTNPENGPRTPMQKQVLDHLTSETKRIRRMCEFEVTKDEKAKVTERIKIAKEMADALQRDIHDTEGKPYIPAMERFPDILRFELFPLLDSLPLSDALRKKYEALRIQLGETGRLVDKGDIGYSRQHSRTWSELKSIIDEYEKESDEIVQLPDVEKKS